MSNTIDQKVVEMQFNNRQFEANVKETMNSVDKLKSALQFPNISKGFDSINASAKSVNLSGLGSAIDEVRMRFNALEVIGVTALANITNSAVNAGKRIASALTIAPIKTGFQEYETQINAVQTILANTQSKGTSLEDVNAALDELNKYADMTIYNFTQMTKNIGTFTAAGVDLEKSVTSIKGIANLAAVSGSTAQQASTAMYQLSQALAAGRVSLMDWNSVVNAGMGGELFQNALKRTAKNMGKNVDAIIAKYGSFRESLTQGEWLTTEVLTETLTQLSGAYTEADLIAQGYTEEQAREITELAQTAVDAATKVKTFTQLWDTLKEAAQSGWAQTWEIIVGDFEEAKEFMTELSNIFGEVIQKSADSRNALLYDSLTSNWKKLTDGITEAGLSVEDFKEKVTEVSKEQGVDIDTLAKQYGSLEKVFRNGAASSEILNQALLNMTGTSVEIKDKVLELELVLDNSAETYQKLVESGMEYSEAQKLINLSAMGQMAALSELDDEQLTNIGYTATQIQSIRELSRNYEVATGSLTKFANSVSVKSGREILLDSIRNSLNSLLSVFGAVGKAWREVFPPATSDQLLGIIESIHAFTESLVPSEETLDRLQRTFRGFFSIISILKQGLMAILSPISAVFRELTGLTGGVLELTASIGDWIFGIDQAIKSGNAFSSAGEGMTSLLDKIAEAIRQVFGNFSKIGDVFRSAGNVVGNVLGSIFDIISSIAKWISDNLSAFDIFAGLAGGGIFVLATKLSRFVDNIVKSFKRLFGASQSKDSVGFKGVLSSVHDSLKSFSQGIKVASLVGIAAAVALLSSSVRKLSEIEPVKLAYSLGAIKLMIMALNSGFKSLVKTLKDFKVKGAISASIAMMAMAKAINILGDAMTKIAQLSLTDLAKGLIGASVSITVLSSAMKRISGSNITLRTSIAMLALAKSCEMLANSLGGFSGLSWGEIARGLTAMGGALVIFTGVLKTISKSSGSGSILGATAILIASQSLYAISTNLKVLGEMSWGDIGRGLTAMSGALTAFTAALSVLSKVGGFGSILGSLGILIAVQSLGDISENLKKLGDMAWDNIGRGLTAMGGALGELTAVLTILGKIGGFGSILGATAILIATQALGDISENIKKLGLLSWSTIARGLTAMGVALSELTAVLGVLGTLGGFSSILGGTAILIISKSLGDIATALSSFGGMDWGSIGRGLTAMGGALGELAVIIGLLGKLGGLSSVIGAASISIISDALLPIADALQKFGGMSWDEIGRGLVAMGAALTEVAVVSGVLGSLTGVFGILGSASLLLGVQGLSDLADALQKFGSMSWDEIGRGLAAMGGALGELALGGFLNTFALIGNIAISAISVSLGDLADSVTKWKDVVVPDGLAAQLSSLASGVNAFMFAGWGADAIATVAEPLGVMADSVRKWAGVTVPEDIGASMEALASGINAFIFSGWGADAIATAAPGVGQMADSIRKWQDVTIPTNLEEGLTGIANGVSAFNFAFTGAWTIGQLVAPLSNLSEAVKKWNDVHIPSDMESGLIGLANGVKSFGLAFVAGWSIDSIIAPLSDLGDAIQKWNGVDVSGLGIGLETLSSGLNSLTGISLDSEWVESFSVLFETIGGSLAVKFITGFTEKSPQFNTSVTIVLMGAITTIQSKYGLFYNAGGYLVSGFSKGITDKTFMAEASAAAMAQAAYNAAMQAMDAHSPSRLFEQAGTYVPMGFANGIVDKIKVVEDSSKMMAKNALDATRKAISDMSSSIGDEFDGYSPTIKPVLDLTNVQSSIGKIDSMIGNDLVQKVPKVVTSKRLNSEEIQNGNSDPSEVSKVEFNQYNYSPKALNRIEIYRQSKNLTSNMKGVRLRK